MNCSSEARVNVIVMSFCLRNSWASQCPYVWVDIDARNKKDIVCKSYSSIVSAGFHPETIRLCSCSFSITGITLPLNVFPDRNNANLVFDYFVASSCTGFVLIIILIFFSDCFDWNMALHVPIKGMSEWEMYESVTNGAACA